MIYLEVEYYMAQIYINLILVVFTVLSSGWLFRLQLVGFLCFVCTIGAKGLTFWRGPEDSPAQLASVGTSWNPCQSGCLARSIRGSWLRYFQSVRVRFQ